MEQSKECKGITEAEVKELLADVLALIVLEIEESNTTLRNHGISDAIAKVVKKYLL